MIGKRIWHVLFKCSVDLVTYRYRDIELLPVGSDVNGGGDVDDISLVHTSLCQFVVSPCAVASSNLTAIHGVVCTLLRLSVCRSVGPYLMT